MRMHQAVKMWARQSKVPLSNFLVEIMKAIGVDSQEGAGQLQLLDLPVPTPASHEVLLKVSAAGVNRPDVLQRRGLYPPPPNSNPRLGLEVAGLVVGVGSAVSAVMLNQPVMALCNGGGYAEYVCVPAAQCMKIPHGLSLSVAATLPEVYMTVWQNLVWKAKLDVGHTVLVHGGSSGIGTAAIQLCKRRGAHVLVTVSTPEKAAYCLSLGADAAYLYPNEDWVQKTLQFTAGRGADVVLDMVAGEYLNQGLACLAPKGMLIVIALQGGRFSSIDASKLLLKQAVLTGTTLRAQSEELKAQLAREVEADLLEGFECGQYRSCLEAQFALKDVAQAHALMESGRSKGKIVLNVSV